MLQLADVITNLSNYSALQSTYWNMYMGVVLAFLALMLESWGKKRPIVTTLFLGIGLSIFFLSNGYEISIQQQRINERQVAIYNYVLKNKDKIPPEFSSLYSEKPTPPPVWSIVALHFVIDFSLIALLIFNDRNANQNARPVRDPKEQRRVTSK
jgi:hypothetical protein